MSKIKVSELFYSLQGEGRFSGVPSVFLRTFGCNFQCAGFGMAKGHLSTEADTVAANSGLYSSYKELPLVSTGCDSYASWHPSFKHLLPMLSINEIVDRIMDLLPFGQWEHEHLVITGGEPLLGWQRSFPALLSHPKMRGLRELTFETNGTQPLTAEFESFLQHWTTSGYGYSSLTFSVSAKLSCSGESREASIKPDVVLQYQKAGYTFLKFVVATEQDAEEALATTAVYRNAGFKGPVYLMGVGGTQDKFSQTNKQVAELALKNGLRYSDRLQVSLYGNDWGT